MYDGWKKLLSVSSGDSFLSDLSDGSSVPLCSKIGAVGMHVTPCITFQHCVSSRQEIKFIKRRGGRSSQVYQCLPRGPISLLPSKQEKNCTKRICYHPCHLCRPQGCSFHAHMGHSNISRTAAYVADYMQYYNL